jgi:thymidine phosphorylase
MNHSHHLVAVNLGIDTHQEPVVFMHQDCHVCRSEGFSASTRVLVECQGERLIATVNTVEGKVLQKNQIGFSKIALKRLDINEGDLVTVKHAPLVESLGFVRKKIYGLELTDAEILAIIGDITNYRYSDIEIASFLTTSAGKRLSKDEIIGLTRAMVICGKRIEWPGVKRIFDKHCVGGLPGNRTTPLVVAIVSAAGLIIPKTSSRAITSPAGTADTMETLTEVNLSMEQIQHVVKTTGACLVWGGGADLSPADDVLIRIERALDIDGEGQLIASVLSKKIAAGSTHVLIDIPVGPTAKVRSQQDGKRLAELFEQVGKALGIEVRSVMTDGSKPIGRGLGPAAEACDVLAVLECLPAAPQDLRERALLLAAQLLDMANGQGLEQAKRQATELLDSGAAWQQFKRILTAQGGMKKLPIPAHEDVLQSQKSGVVHAIDNRRLARLAKLAGAPGEPSAGLKLMVNVGDTVKKGSPLFTLLTNSVGERNYAMTYYNDNQNLFDIRAEA